MQPILHLLSPTPTPWPATASTAVIKVRGQRFDAAWFWLALVTAAFAVACMGATLSGRTHRLAISMNGVSIDRAVLVDPTHQLGLDQILISAPGRFHNVDNLDLTFGYTAKAVWLRFKIRSDRDRSMLLAMRPNFVDLIDIYVAPLRAHLTPRDFRHIALGNQRPIPADGISGLSDVVDLDLKAGETQTAYVRIAAQESPLSTEIRAIAKEDLPVQRATATLLTGAWFGAAAILCVIQLVFYYYDRRAQYLLIGSSMLMAVIAYCGSLGLTQLFLFPNGGAINSRFIAVSVWLLFTATTLPMISVLELRTRNRTLWRISAAGVLLGLIGAALALLGYNRFFAPIGGGAGITFATLAAFEAIRAMWRNETGSHLRAAAYVVLWIGVVVMFSQRLALLPLPNWTAHAHAVACLVQTMLLTASLGVRLRTAESLARTAQQQALDAAQMAEEHAQELVEERTHELAIARQAAEDALQAELRSQVQQVRFMEVISHQYRTPLAAIRTYIDNIGLSLPAEDASNRGRLERMRRGVRRLVEVLEVNMARARLQGPFLQPVLHSESISEIVLATAARGRDLLQSSIETRISREAEAVQVLVDADMLGLAIINLLENAEKFNLTRTQAPIRVSCDVDHDEVLIRVSDEGIGIPPDDLQRIFGANRRAANAHGVEGTGMGLSLVARVASAHKGRTFAESIVNEGTTVTLALPISTE